MSTASTHSHTYIYLYIHIIPHFPHQNPHSISVSHSLTFYGLRSLMPEWHLHVGREFEAIKADEVGEAEGFQKCAYAVVHTARGGRRTLFKN